MGLCDGSRLARAVVIVLLLVVLYWVFMNRKERLSNTIYLDQIVFKNPNPLLMKYTGRERDSTGMSARDYYYENDIDSRNLVAPQYLEGDSGYVDHTDYLGMPLEYRPSTLPTKTIPVPQRGVYTNAEAQRGRSNAARKRDIVPSAISKDAKTDEPIKTASPTSMQVAVSQ
jgi:hypothetical protein